MKGAKIYLRQDPGPVLVGVSARAVKDAIEQLTPRGDVMVEFRTPWSMLDTHSVRIADVVAITSTTIIDGYDEDGDD